jgi:hypothetical protein
MQPMQCSWRAQVVRFFNASVRPAMETASPLMAAALRADMALGLQPGPEAERTWSGRLLRALGALSPGAGTPVPPELQQVARALQRLPAEEVASRVQREYACLWSTDEPGTAQPGTQPRDPRAPGEQHPGQAAYNAWFRQTAGVVVLPAPRFRLGGFRV